MSGAMSSGPLKDASSVDEGAECGASDEIAEGLARARE